MLNASTPITVGLFAVAALGVTVSTGFLIWLWSQFKGLKAEIVELIKAAEQDAHARISGVTTQVATVDGKIALLSERLHAIELEGAKERAAIAETYMSKTSAGAALTRLTDEFAGMRRDVEARLQSIEHHLRRGQ